MYNLPPNDPRVLELTELEMLEEIKLMRYFEKEILELSKNKNDYEEDEDYENLNIDNFNELHSTKTGNFNIEGFTKEELDNFWNDDSFYDIKEEKKNE